MSFIGTNSLTELLLQSEVILPFEATNIKNGAYELTLGREVFQTGCKPRAVKTLKEKEQIHIEPGQFALLLTEEVIKMPGNKIAFISMKAGIKFKGLVNVSGFHVDPGFEGKLLFSVYNAGPSTIVLKSGQKYFPIWFAELNEFQSYSGSHDKQMNIPIDPVEALSQGELASPNELSRRIDDVKNLLTKIEWVALAVLTLFIGLTVKIYTDSNKLQEAVNYGYEKKTNEILFDTTYLKLHSQIKILNGKIDSLSKQVKRNRK